MSQTTALLTPPLNKKQDLHSTRRPQRIIFFCLGDEAPKLSVFDFDQVLWGWIEWDMAQSMLVAYMLAEGSSMLAGDPVPEAQVQLFTSLFEAGYKKIAGPEAVDRARLDHMVGLRKLFCRRFCVRAKSEGPIPPDMAGFIDYVLR